MTNATNIGTACQLTRNYVDRFSQEMSGFFGVISTLDDCARSGGFIHPDTNEARVLEWASAQLRSIANDLDAQRKMLLANEIATRIQAAE